MGKSPGKWIKTILFGKRSSKSSFFKDAKNEKKISVAAEASSGNLAVNPPTVSDLPHQTADRDGENAAASWPGKQGADAKPIMGLNAANDIEITKLEQAATKAQAFFRGYLARRAFRALKGIIRLQALVRGHLVRRQAVATLRCLQAIVNFQTLVRGRMVRLSDGGHEVQKKSKVGDFLNAERVDSLGVNTFIWSEKLRNAFILKLLASSPSAVPLSLQYDPANPNSVLIWLDRWSLSRFWEPLAQPKKIPDLKNQRKQVDMQTAETEPGRTKRGFGKISTVISEDNLLPSSSEYEITKRNPRKILGYQAEQVLEHPQSELERVKRNLRKVSMSTEEASEKSQVVIEKPQSTPKKESTSHTPDVCDQQNDNSSEKLTHPIVTISKQPVLENHPDLLQPLPVTEQIDTLPYEHPNVELHNLENGGKAEKTTTGNEEPISKEDQTSKENQKTRRRRSVPAKQEYPDNISHSIPTLPSYMAATESAKAKLKAQGSPRLGQEVAENGFVRRHSLPSSTNGKLSSILPRMPKVVQSNVKGGSRNDKSLSSSRNEKVLQPGWRR